MVPNEDDSLEVSFCHRKRQESLYLKYLASLLNENIFESEILIEERFSF
jgi:hypothetical protein